jgi:hypothetical protein
MKVFTKVIAMAAITAIMMSLAYQADATAPGPKLSADGNKHNLSSTNLAASIKYRAAAGDPRGTEKCIFCHTPHGADSSAQAPLWNRNASVGTFQRYSSASLQIRSIANAQYGVGAQPNGSSILCLSCHDGVSRLGAVYKGGEIAMTLDTINIADRAAFTDTKMKSGHHPVSFVYNASVRDSINTQKSTPNIYQLPTLTEVKLDKKSRMQCTTCHDAHQSKSHDDQCYGGACNGTNKIKIAPFWVYGGGVDAATDQQAVCTTCHPMDGSAGFSYTTTLPWSP